MRKTITSVVLGTALFLVGAADAQEQVSAPPSDSARIAELLPQLDDLLETLTARSVGISDRAAATPDLARRVRLEEIGLELDQTITALSAQRDALRLELDHLEARQ